MSIEYCVEDVDLPDIKFEIVSKVFKSQLRKHRLKLGELHCIFCSDEFLLKLNSQFLKHNYYTDVITFDYSEEIVVAGDIYISLERVRENAIEFNQLFIVELIRVVFHGFLHLLGYKDKDQFDIDEMRRMEFELIQNYFDLERDVL